VDITMNQIIPWVLPGRSQQPSYEEFTNAQALLERIETIEEKRLKSLFHPRSVVQTPILHSDIPVSGRVFQ